MVSTLKVTKIQIPNSDSDVMSLDASSGAVTFNKAVTFNESYGAAVELISAGGPGTGVSSFEVDLPTDDKYQKFELSLSDAYSDGDHDLRLNFRTQTSGSYATNYTYSNMERTYGASPNGASGNSGSAHIEVGYYNMGNALIEANSYNFIITNNKTASYHTKVFWTAYGLASDANATVRAGGGSVNVAEINDRIKVFHGTATLTYSEYALYGYLRS